MRVLHLPYGGQMITLCSALRDLGVDATSCHFDRSNFNFAPDICLDLQTVPRSNKQSVLREFFNRVIHHYDVFHFHCGLTFFPDHSDLATLKKLGKKVMIQHRGSDVRRLSIARSFRNPYVQVKNRDEQRIISEIKKLSAYIDHAIVADYELLPYIKGFYKNIHIVRQAIDLRKFEPVYPSPAPPNPLLMHAPSHPTVKGTHYIRNAIWYLRNQNYRFKFQLLRKVPHQEALHLYKQADLIIDQMCIGSFGIVSLEGMALGKPVVCYIRDGLSRTYPESLPIINANPYNLYGKLKDLIENPSLLRRLGQQGREYVEKHHDSHQIATQLIKLYQQL